MHGGTAAPGAPRSHQVSDLCIGKPALRWLPPSSTVADAIADLEGHDDAAVAVWDGGGEGSDVVAGRLCMADVLLFLCAHLASPAAALQATLSDLLAAGALQPVRRIDPDASLLDAVDSFLDGGTHALVVPIRDRWRRRDADRGKPCLCWLTVEDVVRFFLSNVGLFSVTALRSVSDLGVIRPATLAVAAGDTALSAVPLLRAALASHASVAVLSDSHHTRCLVGEISPSALCSCDVSAAAAIAALTAGQLVSFVDWGSNPPVAALHAVRSRLRRRNHLGMLDLLYCGGSDASSSSSSSSSASSSSSSSDEDEDFIADEKKKLSSPCAGRGKHGSSFSARRALGRRRAEEAIVCHRGSSLVAVMVQATVHRATHVWVVEEQELLGVVGLLDVLRALRRHLVHKPSAAI